MTLSVWFWVIYVLSLLFGLWTEYTPGQPYPYPHGLRWFLFYLLIGILGIQAFGGPIK